MKLSEHCVWQAPLLAFFLEYDMLLYSSPCPDGGKLLRHDCCHSTPRCPQSILWLGTHCYIHNLLPLMAWRDAGMACRTPAERVYRVFVDLWCVFEGVCVHGCEFIVQLFVCSAAGLSVTAWVSGMPLCKDVEVCHWASLWECSQMLSCSSSRLPAEVYNA